MTWQVCPSLSWLAFLLSCFLDVDKKPVFDIPTIREYFMDLDFVLGVISDGPAKSFPFLRLQYVRGKFAMYTISQRVSRDDRNEGPFRSSF